jgi:hypothetical protein
MPSIDKRSELMAHLFDSYMYHSDDDQSIIIFIALIRGSIDRDTITKLPVIIKDRKGSFTTIDQISNVREKTIRRLLDYGILSYNNITYHYLLHPFIRSFYCEKIEEDETLSHAAHRFLFDYYASLDEQNLERDSWAHLKILIEAVYHACKCGLYSDAWNIYIKRINIPGNYVLTDRFGAYSTAISIMREFFPERNLDKEPLLKLKEAQCQILGNVGYSLMSLGYLRDALYVFERENALSKQIIVLNATFLN